MFYQLICVEQGLKIFGTDVSKIPCFKQSFMLGIGGGAGAGIVYKILPQAKTLSSYLMWSFQQFCLDPGKFDSFQMSSASIILFFQKGLLSIRSPSKRTQHEKTAAIDEQLSYATRNAVGERDGREMGSSGRGQTNQHSQLCRRRVEQ